MANPYTWTEPVTDRSSGSERMTYVDMNRITTNIAWLYSQCLEIGITPSGAIIDKTSWSQNDIIERDFWRNMVYKLENICDALQVEYEDHEWWAVWRTQYQVVNRIEEVSLICYEVLASYEAIPNMNHYIGDKWGTAYRYAGDEMNAGGRYE